MKRYGVDSKYGCLVHSSDYTDELFKVVQASIRVIAHKEMGFLRFTVARLFNPVQRYNIQIRLARIVICWTPAEKRPEMAERLADRIGFKSREENIKVITFGV